jgi:hypothetical protein
VRRDRFVGAIAGVGSTSGVRVVVGSWHASPLGVFADVMVAEPSGRRVLLAPDGDVADFVATTYTFDQVELGPVDVETWPDAWSVTAPGLSLRFGIGMRQPLGYLLRTQPRVLATSPAWTRITDPVARTVLRGVRTRGKAGQDRREYYGATDLHRITGLAGSWRGAELGMLAPVSPEPQFGFGSTPRRPSVTSIVTTVESA